MKYHFNTIDKAENLLGKRILVRVDFNVPIENTRVVDDFRIRKALKTIKFLKDAGARLILISHLDEQNGRTLEPVFEYLNKLFPVIFGKNISDPKAKELINSLKDGDVILFENLRDNPGESANDDRFAKLLSSLADIYVNEAFPVSHRKHTSIVGVPKYLPHFAGFLFAEEVTNLSNVFNPPKPSLFILGGAKFDTKLPLITKFLRHADHVFVGGALSNNIFKEKGFNIGASRISSGNFDIKKIIDNPRLIIPEDVITKNGEKIEHKKSSALSDGDVIVDVGPKTISSLSHIVSSAKCVLWNGPLGQYEEGFTDQTKALAKLVAFSPNAKLAVVGGGDTLASIESLGLFEKIGFVSTGGGAMLQFLLDETLPGIQALERS